MRVPLLPRSCPFFYLILFSSMYQSRDRVCVLCVQQESSLLAVYVPCPDFALLKIHNQTTAGLRERHEMPPFRRQGN